MLARGASEHKTKKYLSGGIGTCSLTFDAQCFCSDYSILRLNYLIK